MHIKKTLSTIVHATASVVTNYLIM